LISPEEHPPVEDTESEEGSLSREESIDEITPEEPATPLIINQSLPDVTAQFEELYINMTDPTRGRNLTLALTADRVAASYRSFKVNALSEFSG
jgi:hypothetical protein